MKDLAFGGWEELMEWTDEDRREFQQNILDYNDDVAYMIRNDTSVGAAIAIRVLSAAEDQSIQKVKEQCYDILSSYYSSDTKGIPDPVLEGIESMKKRIELLASEHPKLMERI